MTDLNEQEALARLWAKTGDNDRHHLLIYHLVDVGQSAIALWRKAFNPFLKKQFLQHTSLTEDEMISHLAFWIGLHDIGKAAPAFQAKVKRFVTPLREAGLPFGRHVDTSVPHGWISHYVLGYRNIGLLETRMGLQKKTARQISRAVAGHHGSWPLPTNMRNAKRDNTQGGAVWGKARVFLFNALKDLFQPAGTFPTDFLAAPETANPFLILLSGFTSTADWIGSMAEYFPYHDELMPLNEYYKQSGQQAMRAVSELGWEQWHSTGELLDFDDLFPGFDTPNDLQTAVININSQVEPPAMFIVEGQTGMGKTEAAYYISDQWAQKTRGQGIYIAMPTQATSNQMFSRTTAFLTERYRDYNLETRLLHSQARWSPRQTPSGIGDPRKTEDKATYQWFTPKKRGLLAPFAVGTVDQALISILLTKHYFVRLFALAGKVVVFDEVHAYDFYMNELFQMLLRWLRRLGTSVVILSATLPDMTRRQLVAAYTGLSVEEIPPSAYYPRLTATDTQGNCIEAQIPTGDIDRRTIQVHWLSSDGLEALLGDELREGGCAVVIRNTVRAAIETYENLLDTDLVHEDEILLFHSRFPFAWRKEIEEQVLARFGKDGDRPERFVLVATQVVEQSLDLDFDLMITDLAPVDLLIQRVGRLHRHDHTHYHNRQRPRSLRTPEVYVFQAEEEDGEPAFDRGSQYIYGEFLLLATWLTLQERTMLVLPDDTVPLIESVYGEGWRGQPLQERLSRVYHQQEQSDASDGVEASIRMIYSPQAPNLLTQPNPALSEDAPDAHQRWRAMTRLIDPGVTIICLHEGLNGFALDPEGFQLVRLDVSLDFETIQHLMQHTVTIHDNRVLGALINGEAHQLPLKWRESKALRFHSIAVFSKVNVEWQCPVEGTDFILVLDRDTGLRLRDPETEV